MELIKIVKLRIKKFSEIYDVKKYRSSVQEKISVLHYTLNDYKIKINNRK